MKDPIEQGQDSAMRHLEEIKDYICGLDNKDRIEWWAGFIGAATGCACATIGPSASKKILDGISFVVPVTARAN